MIETILILTVLVGYLVLTIAEYLRNNNNKQKGVR